jgi:hypothetical protein
LTTIYDNIVESLGEQLIKTFQASERIDAAVGYFNLRGWRDLSEELDTRDPNADGSPVARVIVGMTGPSSHEAVLEDLQREVAGENKDISLDGPEAKKRRKEAMERFKEQLMRGLPDAARKKALLRMRRHLNDGVLRVRLFTRRPMHGKTYICHREDVATPIIGYVGSSNLTLPGLKYQYELNVDVIDGDAATKLAKWFQDRWDDEFCLDITQELIDLLDESWAAEKPADPYLIYLKVCYLKRPEMVCCSSTSLKTSTTSYSTSKRQRSRPSHTGSTTAGERCSVTSWVWARPSLPSPWRQSSGRSTGSGHWLCARRTLC